MSFNTNLKKYRESKGYTQKQVAKILGITEQSYQRYECGTREPSFEMIKNIGKVLKVSPVYFFSEDAANSSFFNEDTGFSKRFNNAVDEYCKDLNIDEETFISILEVIDRNRYEDIKTGLAEPTLFELARIVNVLEVSSDYLIGVK